MSSFLKKFSDFLGISDPEYIRAPPLDGEIIYCKNNVCVHPPSNLAKNAEHYPGYLTLRSQGSGHVGSSSLILTWIPNSSLDRPRIRSPRSSSEGSPVKDAKMVTTCRDGKKMISTDDPSDEGLIIDKSPTKDSSNSVKSEIESLELEKEDHLMNDEPSIPQQNGSVSDTHSPKYEARRASDASKSSESDLAVPTDAQLAALLLDGDKGTKMRSVELERPQNLELSMTNNSNNSKAKEESLSSASSNPSSLPSPLRSLMRDQMIRDLRGDNLSDGGSSTTATTSNPDLGSLPSSPGTEQFDPFMPLYNHKSPPPSSLVVSPTSPVVSHNLTFPENAIEYTTAGGSRSSLTPKEQLCGVFSVDLSHMRSLRVFFSNESNTSGQLVIASKESQYKILHFHHGGLNRLTDVFAHWRYCIKQKSKSKLDKGEQLYHKFSILQSKMTQDDCHPEEGVYDVVNEEMWWSYLNERGQVEDNYGLRKAVFFGGIDEYLRRDIWPFLLHYFSFTSTLEERNALRGQKRNDYEEILQKRLAMSEEDQEVFWRTVKSTVDKDVIRTDRSHPYFKGDDNPNIDIMRNILLNFAVFKPSLGYTQGMSDLLAPVLAELQDEADAFWCFEGLMESIIFVSSPKDDDMERQLGYLRALIELMLPDFWNHLVSLEDAMDMLFCHRWILLCFKREFSEPEALRMWEACWAHYQTDYFHLFICLAIIAVYGEDIVHQRLPSDDMLLHFSNLSMQMNGDLVLKKARGMLHQFRLLRCIPCTLDKLCEMCTPGMWDSGHTPEVECVGLAGHGEGFACPHIR